MSGRASPGGSTARSERWTVRSWFVYVPVFSPHIAAGSTTSASSPVSVRNGSLTTTTSRSCSRIERIRWSSGSETAGFVPMSGRLDRFVIPTADGVRVDAGYETGSVVSAHYDAMLAKVIAHAPTRSAAIASAARVLREAEVHGVPMLLCGWYQRVAADFAVEAMKIRGIRAPHAEWSVARDATPKHQMRIARTVLTLRWDE